VDAFFSGEIWFLGDADLLCGSEVAPLKLVETPPFFDMFSSMLLGNAAVNPANFINIA
jgi:hypothetical protein